MNRASTKPTAFRLPILLLGFLLAAVPAAAQEPVDNCASMLGSIGVELRYARRLPASERTTFLCPRDTSALIGASRQRILNALGPPDLSGHPEDAAGVLAWYYYFGPSPGDGEDRDKRQPELRFDFNLLFDVSAVHCRQRH